jgi:hypothetical protein
VAVNHNRDAKTEELIVTLTRKMTYNSDDGILSQATTNLEFSFNLGPTVDLVTLPGLPLKLYPSWRNKMSTFAAFVENDSSQSPHHIKPPSEFQDIAGSAVLIIEVLGDSSRLVTVKSWINLEQLESVKLVLPPSDFHCHYDYSGIKKPINANKEIVRHASHVAGPVDASVKEALFHYYRGSGTYDRLQEMKEYLQTAVVGFLSPFVLLGILFVGIAIGVFVWLHVLYEKRDDESYPTDPNRYAVDDKIIIV